jgi:hypothetical protein
VTKVEKTQDDIDNQVELEIAAGLEADRAKRRVELALAARRKIEAAHYAKINARHPVEGPLAGLTPAQHQARLDAMAAGAKADKEWMDRVNARPVEGSLAARRADSVGGSAGFRVKPPGGA